MHAWGNGGHTLQTCALPWLSDAALRINKSGCESVYCMGLTAGAGNNRSACPGETERRKVLRDLRHGRSLMNYVRHRALASEFPANGNRALYHLFPGRHGFSCRPQWTSRIACIYIRFTIARERGICACIILPYP